MAERGEALAAGRRSTGNGAGAGAGPRPADARRSVVPPLGAVLKALVDDVLALFALQIELAKHEALEAVSSAQRGLIAFGVAAVLAAAGLVFLMFAAMLMLARHFDDWMAAGIVGAGALGVAALLVLLGRRWLAAGRLAPRRTIRSIREHAQLLKDETP